MIINTVDSECFFNAVFLLFNFQKYLYAAGCINILQNRFGVIVVKNKKNKLPLAARLSNATQIPFDMTGCCPYIKMCYNREVLVEDAGKLVQYDRERVCVLQRNNKVFIVGNDLYIDYLSNGDLRVTGFIKNVGFDEV